ncbi:alpha-2-macroglobulin [Niastella caeni]|uniref:Alpha-2-macroglobulin n=1 Tax=Niastella caeni TaxID=2569763 RepID=A0A4S8I2J8_9BACT|nr:alpha-2-macroglobulin family protein [Niastella caeni]THU40904.1 alpha-2-macroglobulin [Niastella caeni]
MNIKRILSVVCATLIALATNGQQKMKTYDKEWKQIDSLIQKSGLTESALTAVKNIYSLAKKEGNDAQMIKALLYQAGLQQEKQEDAVKKSIQQLEGEIAASKEPVRAVLQSITAQKYWVWFQQHRWQLYHRTQTVNFKKDDLATWSTDDFHKKISELYLASISNEKLLQQTKLEAFDPVIIKGNVRHLRPTLFDLLAHRGLDYFKNNESTITKPVNAFEIDDAAAFNEAKKFMNHAFTTRDSLSLQFKALQLYQRLLQLHAADTKPDAFIDVDVERLQYVYNNATMENKDALYIKALEQIGAQYGLIPAATQAWYLMAQWHVNQAREYDPLKGDTNRYDYLKAKSICDKVIARADSSEGKLNCTNLMQEIVRKEMNLQTEKVNVPGQPFRTLISWRNFTKMNFRVVKLDAKTRESLGTETWDDDYWKKLVQLPTIKTFSQELPDTKDYQKHTTEIKIDALPIGEYAIIASVNDKFILADNQLAVQYFYVSNIAYINKGPDYFVVHRETGQPLANAKVQVWYRSYDHNKRKYTATKGQSGVTNENGYIKVIPDQNNNERNYKLEITSGDDHLMLEDYSYNYTYPQFENVFKDSKIAFLFTDRSIYRPGQIVYFKGILISRNAKNGESVILPNFATSLSISDPNGQPIDTIQVTTNEYGAYSGKLTLPTNVLNGVFNITDVMAANGISFSVEEYKRPKFLVEISKPTGTYRLNENITVNGIAKAYAGNAIDGAKVKYRVVRKTIMPLWFYGGFRKMIWPPYGREEVEIAHGEVSTDAKGEFKISFKAQPDNSIAKKDQPTFYYEVSADVTDIAGETRSANTQVAVAYQALKLKLDVPEKIHADSLNKVRLSSTNLNELFEKTTVTVSVHKLKMPDRLFRERYWPQPDTFVLSQQEFYAAFPYDVYKNENDPSKWAKEQKVAEKTDTTSGSKPSTIGLPITIGTPLAPGWYTIEATTKDKYGEEVKDVRYVQVYNQSIVSPLATGGIESNNTTLEPGDKASYQVSTTVDNAFVIHDLMKKDDFNERSFFTLNKNSRSFERTITEKDRGGFGIQTVFVKHNRVYTDNLTFSVPYTNKELTIAYETFRDKTLPGSEEKWKVKISGYKGDKVAAEMLTAMYDASLDQFKPHSWQKPDLWDIYYPNKKWDINYNFSLVQSLEKNNEIQAYAPIDKTYDQLGIALFDISIGSGFRSDRMLAKSAAPGDVPAMAAAENVIANQKNEAVGGYKDLSANGVVQDSNAALDEATTQGKKPEAPEAAVQLRKNFNETAFFFPDLHTDANGNIEFSFTMPEAVTQWKWMSLAHTKDLSFGYNEKTIVTQKDLMVQPNAPRFLREGDRMNFSGKIANLTDKEITGQVQLVLIDATTNQSIDGWFKNVIPNQYFTVPAQQSVPVTFSIEIPYQYNKPVTYRLIAKAANISDGEEAMLPVVSNRMLVTESLPLPVRGNTTKNFTFEKLVKSGSSETLNHHALTVEYTSNPAWYAVQALPYLMEYPYDCAEQVFNRYYANALASTIANASPRIKQIFERWKTADTAALLSNLQKNEELKSVLLQETPWVLQAKNEAQQKKNIALLFDLVRMSSELNKSITKLKELQSTNGGFVWFKGGPDDRYITQYILTGIGHLKKLKAIPAGDETLDAAIKKAIPYLDERIKEDYENMLKYSKKTPNDEYVSPLHIQYLYMRSFFPEYGVPGSVFKAYNYYRSQAQKSWVKQSRYMQGMIALSLFRTGDVQTARNIVKSIKENALTNEEMGMYWKEFTGGYYWYQSPIESHSLLMETFSEVTKDVAAVNDLKVWLLKQKQTQNWRTTKATADACYALLLQGTDLLTNTPDITIALGSTTVSSKDQKQEAGTGYFKKVFDEKQVKPEMGNIKVTVSNSSSPNGGANQASASWGAVYWQYFENLNKITSAATPLQLTKKLFVEKNTDRGPVLQPVNEGDAMKVGDKVKVRIELRVDRTMEYVHMKDMRAACMEPVNVISEYKWQGGLGYYESTKDASTNFFFGQLPKGTYVFEYPLFVTHTGTFSNGITTIQCMYAPEFTSHSEGINVKVE